LKVNGAVHNINALSEPICELDLGLHHLEVFTGNSVYVDFGSLVVGATAISSVQVISTKGFEGDTLDISCSNVRDGIAVFQPDYDADNNTTSLSGHTIKAVELYYTEPGKITLGKIDLTNVNATNITNKTTYNVTETGFVNVKVEDMELGVHETLCLVNGDAESATIRLMSSNVTNAHRIGWGGIVPDSMFGFYGRIVFE
jgi:hypothetical protein